MAHAAKSIIAFTFRGDGVQKVTSISKCEEEGPQTKLVRK